MVVVFNRCTFAGGGAPFSVGNTASNFANACAMRSKFLGEPLRTKNVGDKTSLNFSHREQAYHEANTSVLANSGIQPSWVITGIGDGGATTKFNNVPKRWPDKGNAEVNQMKFKGEGEVSATF